MQKAERDHVLTRLSPAEREQFRHIIQDMRVRSRAVSGSGMTARQILVS